MKTTVLSLVTATLAAGALVMAAPATANAGQVRVSVHLGAPVYAEPVVVYQPVYPVVVYQAPVVYYRPHPHHHGHHRHHNHHAHHLHRWQGHGGHHAKHIAEWKVNPRIEHRR